jgi:DNA-binding MarR family transcriptional regulator
MSLVDPKRTERLQGMLRDLLGEIEREGATIRPTETSRHLGVLAERILSLRRKREQVFGAALFGEPGWDLLLDIYATVSRGRKVSITGACEGAGVPMTTALRWLHALESHGLLVRTPDANDGRRVWLSLTPSAVTQLEEVLSQWS